MSGIISAPQFYRVFPDLDPAISGHKHSSTMQAFYTAIYEVGCLAGASFALFFGNKLGRRKNIGIGESCTTSAYDESLLNSTAGAFFVIIGAIIQITAIPGLVNFLNRVFHHLLIVCSNTRFKAGHQFVIGRIVTGVGNGALLQCQNVC